MPQSTLDPHATPSREAVVSRWIVPGLVALTPAVLLVHGYHPFSDDASIYVAGIRKLVDPALYKPDAAFVLANTRLSLFAHAIAATIRVSRVPLTVVLLATHLASIFLFLLAGWSVASRLFSRAWEQWSAVAFAAACFTLPVAGTALVVMDPYVTARSFSTPLGLFAVAAALDRRWGLATLFLALMGLMHPLMVVYAAALIVFYATFDTGHPRVAILLGLAEVGLAGMIWLATRHEAVSHAFYEAMHSRGRTFLFLAQWKWYEDLGLVLPLALLGLTAYRARAGRVCRLCLACIVLGVCSTVAAILFVHVSGPYLLVRVQLLRSFHIIYALGVLLLGGWLGSVLGYRRRTRWILPVLLAMAGGGLFLAQRATYPHSRHIEWPGARPHNLWVQAYGWINGNTPADAYFAADPNLQFRDGVDTQGFRAIAERSLLADDKDQGIAALDPPLAGEWAAQRDAHVGLETMTDTERIRRLQPFGVTWLLLSAGSPTNFPCPYRNAVAKVCRMD